MEIPKCSVTFAVERDDDPLGWALIGRGADNALASSRLSLLGGPEHDDRGVKVYVRFHNVRLSWRQFFFFFLVKISESLICFPPRMKSLGL